MRTGLYLGLGWGALFCYFDIARKLSHRAMRPFLAGGVFYSVGAVLNLLHWPVLWPGVFQAHELFHLFVMAGSLSHFWFILTAVATFDPAAPLNRPPGPPGFRAGPHTSADLGELTVGSPGERRREELGDQLS